MASRPSKYRGCPKSGTTIVKSHDSSSPAVTSLPCHQASRFWKSKATSTTDTASKRIGTRLVLVRRRILRQVGLDDVHDRAVRRARLLDDACLRVRLPVHRVH